MTIHVEKNDDYSINVSYEKNGQKFNNIPLFENITNTDSNINITVPSDESTNPYIPNNPDPTTSFIPSSSMENNPGTSDTYQLWFCLMVISLCGCSITAIIIIKGYKSINKKK